MKINSVHRITISIVSICVAALLIAGSAGIIPDERYTKAEHRAQQCEALVANVTFSIGKHELHQASRQLELFQSRQKELLSAGLRFNDGTLVAQSGRHGADWADDFSNLTDGCYVVQIASSKGKWGVLELRYTPIFVGYNRVISTSMLKLLMLVIPLVGAASLFHLQHILKYLDPGQVVPSRVRQTLDNFAEGIVLLDSKDRIVLTNRVFARNLDMTIEELIGARLWSLPWDFTTDDGSPIESLRAPAEDASVIRGTTMRLTDKNGDVQAIFSVNASPVLDDKGKYQGLIAAFADITPLEQSRARLSNTLSELKESKDAITKQNEELRYLATRDPLTECINRRTFFDDFQRLWDEAKAGRTTLCAMMIDIDFFKPINDNYGHSMGDEVLRQTGHLLNSMTRKEDVVCRYGGEEFSILMPGLSLEQAEIAAESIRIRVSEIPFPDFTITASLGVSGFDLGADDPQGMLEQADKCLYVAKRNGRNRVIRFDTVPKELIVDESKILRENPEEILEIASPKLPYAAVTALHSALAYRDPQTGSHCLRVSNYAALVAQKLLGPSDVFVVEIATLLHDVGKVGVPDSILLKPGKLSDEEWQVMDKHDRIGVEIINSSFRHQSLTEIVQFHHFHFGGEKARSQELAGEAIPIGARILTVVDAFDAMVSDRPYRKAMPGNDAIKELQRCSGTQFDPAIVQSFIEIIHSGRHSMSQFRSGSHENDALLSVGEQIERLVEAAEFGNEKTFVALVERLRLTAKQHNVTSIVEAASNAIAAVDEDSQLNTLVQVSFELMAACREMRSEVEHSNRLKDLIDS